MTWAEVRLWGRTIGAVSMGDGDTHAAFQYDPAFARSGIEVSPITMPLGDRIYTFPALPPATYHGLPGLLADSLPDRFGHAVIDAWLSAQGRSPESFDAVERLCYIGSRGMGALEFAPSTGPATRAAKVLRVDVLVERASSILSQRQDWKTSLAEGGRTGALRDILRVGTSAGGARAKAVIAWNRQTNDVRSGQVAAGSGFESWLLKLDGVTGNEDNALEDPKGYGAIEYAYSLMARAAGITMAECHLLEERHRRHFMTRRFDRLPDGEKLHMQSLGALAHLDYNQPGAHAYEQAMLAIRRLGLPAGSVEETFRRMAFNIVARNQNDHVKNVAFLMDKRGSWALAPAFDVIYSYNPSGPWTATHQMTMNGKRDGFTMGDFRACGRSALLPRGRADAVVDQVREAVVRWPDFAEEAGVPQASREEIRRHLRLTIART